MRVPAVGFASALSGRLRRRALGCWLLLWLSGCGDSGAAGADTVTGDVDGSRVDGGDSAAALGAGDYDFEVHTDDGRTRHYLVHVPETTETRPAVLLALHGGGGSAQGTIETTGLVDTADANGFVLALPEGIPATDDGGGQAGPNATWNTGNCCGRALEENVDDVAYVGAVLDDLATRTAYDPGRVYATGISNGSMLSNRLACDLSERIAAIAPVAGQITGFECNPSRPVPVMHIHGTEDGCAPYAGGSTCGGCFQRVLNEWLGSDLPEVTWPCDPVVDYIADWRARDDCDADSTIGYERGSARCESWSCAAGSEVSLCTVEGMGHTWPGGMRPDFCNFPNSRICMLWIDEVGDLTTDIGNDQIWAFLKRFSLP